MSKKESPPSDEFQDPLENYDPKVYHDELERALAEENVAALHSTPFATIPSSLPIREAVAQLAGQHIACLLVEEQGKLVGVFTDRDVLDRVTLEYEDVQDRPVSTVMTAEPVYVNGTDSSAAALTVMAVSGFRHVPVLGSEEKIAGIVSPHRITEFLKSHFGPSVP